MKSQVTVALPSPSLKATSDNSLEPSEHHALPPALLADHSIGKATRSVKISSYLLVAAAAIGKNFNEHLREHLATSLRGKWTDVRLDSSELLNYCKKIVPELLDEDFAEVMEKDPITAVHLRRTYTLFTPDFVTLKEGRISFEELHLLITSCGQLMTFTHPEGANAAPCLNNIIEKIQAPSIEPPTIDTVVAHILSELIIHNQNTINHIQKRIGGIHTDITTHTNPLSPEAVEALSAADKARTILQAFAIEVPQFLHEMKECWGVPINNEAFTQIKRRSGGLKEACEKLKDTVGTIDRDHQSRLQARHQQATEESNRVLNRITRISLFVFGPTFVTGFLGQNIDFPWNASEGIAISCKLISFSILASFTALYWDSLTSTVRRCCKKLGSLKK